MVAQTIEAMPRTARTHTEHTEQPAGLTLEESRAYVRGYARGCLAYVKKNGAASVSLEGPAPAPGTPERRALGVQLAELTRTHEEERHPSAHRAGMAALRKYRKTHGIPEPVAPKKTATRKPAARKLAAVPEPVETAAPVVAEPLEPAAPAVRLIPSMPAEQPAEQSTDESTEQQQNRTRKLARRELAAAMRARGENPSDPAAWAAAKLAAGVK